MYDTFSFSVPTIVGHVQWFIAIWIILISFALYFQRSRMLSKCYYTNLSDYQDFIESLHLQTYFSSFQEKNHFHYFFTFSHLARPPFLSRRLITCMLYFPNLSSGVSSCSFILFLGSLLQNFLIFPHWVVLIKSFLPQLLESTFLFAVIANISTIYKWNYTVSAPLLSYRISPRTMSSKFIQAAACSMTPVFKVK